MFKTNDFFASKALAAIFAITVSAVFLATAIIPASPAGLIA
ncbi:recombination protein F [Qipengyuania sp.]